MAPDPTRKRGLRHASVNILGMLQRPLDVAVIVFAHYCASVLRSQPWGPPNTGALIVGVAVFYLVAEGSKLYRPAPGASLKQEGGRLLTVWAVVVPILLFLAFLTKTSEQFSRIVAMLWLLLTPVLLVLSRIIVRLCAKRLQGFNRLARRVAILGATPIGVRIAKRFATDQQAGAELIGYYDDRGASRREQGWNEYAQVVGDVAGLIDDARDGNVDSIYIALPLRAEPRINEIVRRLADTTADVYVVPDFLGLDLLRAEWSSVEGIAVVNVVSQPAEGFRAWLKRMENAVRGAVRA